MTTALPADAQLLDLLLREFLRVRDDYVSARRALDDLRAARRHAVSRLALMHKLLVFEGVTYAEFPPDIERR